MRGHGLLDRHGELRGTAAVARRGSRRPRKGRNSGELRGPTLTERKVGHMGFLNERDRQTLTEMFRDLKFPVHLELFVDPDQEWSQHTRGILAEVVALMPDFLHLETYHFEKNRLLGALYGVTQVPCLILRDKNEDDSGIRILGIPSGYEFAVLIEDILDVSTGRNRLREKSLNYIRNLEHDIVMQVFVTPTCPHCPRAVRLAHQMALANPARVRGESIDANTFIEWADQEEVYSVPKTVLTAKDPLKTVTFEGAVSEEYLIRQIKLLLDDPVQPELGS